ncbi:heme exporter protein CcmD [Agromyces allii]|uniref:heme exporter protein CcmD n=1 Tax=Agromyces allii TaxID=393607 RepID=UPI0012F95152|nr:heme exporter protein CcmD [Agromyces allii]
MSAATALLAAQVALAPLVRAADDKEFDPNDVTPGVWGFVITFAIMVAVVLLVLDMTRRIRRTNYRAEVQQELAREMAEADAAKLEQIAQAEAAASGTPIVDAEPNDAGPNAAGPDATGPDAASGDQTSR